MKSIFQLGWRSGVLLRRAGTDGGLWANRGSPTNADRSHSHATYKHQRAGRHRGTYNRTYGPAHRHPGRHGNIAANA